MKLDKKKQFFSPPGELRYVNLLDRKDTGIICWLSITMKMKTYKKNEKKGGASSNVVGIARQWLLMETHLRRGSSDMTPEWGQGWQMSTTASGNVEQGILLYAGLPSTQP